MKLSELNFNRYLYKDLGASDEIDSSLLASNLFDENKNKLSPGDTAYDLNSSSLLLNGGVIAPSTITFDKIGSVQADTIIGSIVAEQIDTITAEQITGSITSEQIDTITAEQITGSITSEQIDTITAEQITGSITSEQIGSVSAETINGSITADQVGSINASVINGVIITEQLADNIIDNLALFAEDLRPIKQVDVLPTLPDTDFPEGATVYLTTDQKLYRNALGAWSSSAAASDITGQLTASQIGSVNSDAITGLILAAQINTIESNQITGSILSSQIENIASTKIDGQITSAQIENIAVDKIDGQITSNQIENIAADKIDGQIISNQIENIEVDKIDGQIIATQIDSIDATTITIGLIKNNQINSVSASKLTAGTIDADVISVINLDASNITSGSLRVGGTSEPSYIELANSTRGTSGKLRWEQGSKIWEDDNGDMGINATGGDLYIYCNNSQIALFKYNAKTQFFGDTSFQATVYLSSTNNTFIWGNDNTNVHIGTSSSGTLIYKRGGVTKAEFGNNLTLQGHLYQPNVNYIELDDYRLTLTANKTAIVPTSKGFNALYCMESPEVWFMDFVKRKNKLDPMFEEVTVPPYHYIKCSGGGYQVWGKRRGHENKRFESKSEADFLANERFLSMNKVKK